MMMRTIVRRFFHMSKFNQRGSGSCRGLFLTAGISPPIFILVLLGSSDCDKQYLKYLHSQDFIIFSNILWMLWIILAWWASWSKLGRASSSKWRLGGEWEIAQLVQILQITNSCHNFEFLHMDSLTGKAIGSRKRFTETCVKVKITNIKWWKVNYTGSIYLKDVLLFLLCRL